MANQDTALYQEGESQFPATSWSLLASLRDPQDSHVQEFLGRMISTYWRPVYKFVRVAWKRSNEDAKDLTQSFFVHVMEGGLLRRADPDRGNFRRLLITSLRNFLANEARFDRAAKRGGGRAIVSLSGSDEDGHFREPADPETALKDQWAREILERAIDRLGRILPPPVFAAFRMFHFDQLPVRRIAGDLRATEAQVGHYLQDARAELRRLVTLEIREYVQDETQVAQELDALFQAWR